MVPNSPGRSPSSCPTRLFAAFVVYPIGYALWLGSDPSLYAQLLSDPRYVRVAVNSVLLVGLAVTLQMSLALLLSGFFARPRRWIKALLVVYILPRRVSASFSTPACARARNW